MTETKDNNSLADFLVKYKNTELLEGVVDTVEVRANGRKPTDTDDFACVASFRVNPTLRDPYRDRRYFFILPYRGGGVLPQCELVVGDEVKIFFEYEVPNSYHVLYEFVNMTTGRVYKVEDEQVKEIGGS